MKCSGCSACAAVCPKENCIKIEYNADGFLRPVKDDTICVHCGLCEKVCPMKAAHGCFLDECELYSAWADIRFTLSDTAQAARILERNFHENHFSIQDDHNLRLHNLDLPVGKIVTAFVENGLEVSEAHTCEESLEDYFKRVTGGEGIA